MKNKFYSKNKTPNVFKKIIDISKIIFLPCCDIMKKTKLRMQVLIKKSVSSHVI